MVKPDGVRVEGTREDAPWGLAACILAVTRFVSRMQEGLAKIDGDPARAKTGKNKGAVERRVGRSPGANSRAEGAFEVVEDASRASGLRLAWSRVKGRSDWASLSEGCYLLRANLTGRAPEEPGADLHAAHGRRGGVQDGEDGAQDPSDMAPA